MTDDTITLRRAWTEDLDRVEAFLTATDLPAEDVRSGTARFFLAEAEGAVVCVGGLEVYESVALLRSVAVDESVRGEGLGSELCDALEARARDEGVDTVYLLTTTAAGFFERQGYEVVERDVAPSAIRETSEFRDLCPGSAVCMRKQL